MPAFKPVDPDRAVRELRQDFKDIQRGRIPDGEEGVAWLAAFVRRAHTQRMINMVLHTAPILLDRDPAARRALIDVYTDHDDPYDRLRGISDLMSLAGWIADAELGAAAAQLVDREAPAWVADATGAERRRRLRDLEAMFGRELADRIRSDLGEP